MPEQIRRMELGDVPRVAALEQRIFPDPWSSDAFAHEARAGHSAWPRVVVDEAGNLAGYLVGWFVADEAHLANLAVDPDLRRRGLAERLVIDLVNEAVERGARMVVLEVRRSNAAAQSLYEKHGFYTVSVRKRYYRDNGEDALIMIKPLNPAGRIRPEKGIGS